ncbi:hypothetical protein MAPG_08706 [Magnaporthiopsis poae ATCC 64411]|uniref:ER membrane protein complex subunit 10 n=1 Tax=Magnaporthiopsis poae (strain ATCC 64411 / 73-15) TaxID=644358 RepID=A0A0C4E820_MAGP6|nr:hypothetical protein MAPG_08706 [Magnaporthiopsis poae ATCC 64411]
MRSLQLLGGLLAASSSLVRAEPQTASIYIQPIGISSPPPTLLAEITFDLSPSSSSSSSDDNDGAAAAAAAEAELGNSGGAIKAAVTAFEAPELPDDETTAGSSSPLVRIGVYDAAAGRWASSTQPALNRPVVLSAEGKQVPPVEEKTLLQKYWWLAALLVFLVVTGGGDGK